MMPTSFCMIDPRYHSMPSVIAMHPAVAEFLDKVRKSELIPEPQFQLVHSKLSGQADKLTDPNVAAAALIKHGFLTTWQAKAILKGRYRNFILNGKHIVLDHLGTGGMSSVYLCEHIRLKQLVAIKLIETSVADQAAVKRFEREARVIFSLNHRNIVRAFDFDQDGKQLFIVMEYVDGLNLHSVVEKQGPLPVDLACNYIVQAADGLQHAALSGLVHRDIKPGNLLLDRAGIVKVLDLGLARSQKQQDGLTQLHDNNAVLGTIDYMAPEQALGGGTSVDIRADIYSLGVTFYFLLTGKVPFSEGSTAQKLLSHQMMEPVPVEEYRRDLPAGISQLIGVMLKKNPAERPTHPMEVAQRLQQWASPVTPPHAGILPKYTPRVQRLLSTPLADSMHSTVTTLKALNMPITTRTGSNPSGVRPRVSANSSGAIPRVPSTQQYQLELQSIPTTKRLKPLSTIARQRVSSWVIIVAVSATVVLAGILYWMLAGANKPTMVQSAPSQVKLPLRVSKRPEQLGQPSVYSSVAQALRQATAGDQITIMDDVWMEQVNEAGLRLQQVTLTSAGDKPVRWIPPPEASIQPLLSLRDARGMTIRNIIFDGEGKVATILRLEGSGTGLECLQLHFQGMTREAVQLAGLKANADQSPMKLDECRFLCNQPEAFPLSIDAQVSSTECQGIRVTRCIFHGNTRQVIDIRAMLSHLELQNNRIFGAEALFRQGEVTSLRLAHITVQNNNFHTMKQVFAFRQGLAEDNRIEFKYNLLVNVPLMLETSGETTWPTWLIARENCCDECSLIDMRHGSSPPKVVTVPRINCDNPTALDYLYPPRTSEAATIKASNNMSIGASQ
jgi:eukaryotic-like serine/threonine-protein kinase